jgi:phosphate transport system permease protein
MFGGLSMIYGTVAVAAIALGVGAPLGVGAAVFLREIGPRRIRSVGKAAFELLAGVPSVVYGLLGVLYLRGWVFRSLGSFELLSGDTLLTAGLLLAVMILPTVMTLADDALAAVPGVLRESARGLGMTRSETIRSVVFPSAARGIVAAVLLGLGRAIGETIAVFLLVGRADNRLPSWLFSLRPLLGPGQTITTKLGGAETNIAYGDALHWGALAGLGLTLLVLTLALTLVAEAMLLWRRNVATAH